MPDESAFDLQDFLPYLLNQAAERTSLGFQRVYKDRYGMLRTEWRVLFHLGRYGDMTATEIGRRAMTHKTKVSRAVAALERRKFLTRSELEHDRRHELLALTPAGKAAFEYMQSVARDYNDQLASEFTEDEQRVLGDCLRRLAKI